MNTHADKTHENKSQSVANAVSQKKNSGESTFQFIDNRPEAMAQRKLLKLISNKTNTEPKIIQGVFIRKNGETREESDDYELSDDEEYDFEMEDRVGNERRQQAIDAAAKKESFLKSERQKVESEESSKRSSIDEHKDYLAKLKLQKEEEGERIMYEKSTIDKWKLKSSTKNGDCMLHTISYGGNWAAHLHTDFKGDPLISKDKLRQFGGGERKVDSIKHPLGIHDWLKTAEPQHK